MAGGPHDERAIGDDDLKILVIDADTILHPQDLAFREYCHRQEAERAVSRGDRGIVLQSLTTYTSNYWKVPMLPRLHNSGFVLYQMGKMQTSGDYLVLGPGTSLPFRDFRAVDYFEPNRHNEDMQFRYKVVMEGFRVAPLKMPTWGQAPLTSKDSWAQIARWARGAVDVKFVVNYVHKFAYSRMPLVKRKSFLAVRALFANAMPPLWCFAGATDSDLLISPCVRELWPFQVFLSPDARPSDRPRVVRQSSAAFNLGFRPRPDLLDALGHGAGAAHAEADHLPAAASPVAAGPKCLRVVSPHLHPCEFAQLFSHGHGPALYPGPAGAGHLNHPHRDHPQVNGFGFRVSCFELQAMRGQDSHAWTRNPKPETRNSEDL
jgi:hypothetical protein